MIRPNATQSWAIRTSGYQCMGMGQGTVFSG